MDHKWTVKSSVLSHGRGDARSRLIRVSLLCSRRCQLLLRLWSDANHRSVKENGSRTPFGILGKNRRYIPEDFAVRAACRLRLRKIGSQLFCDQMIFVPELNCSRVTDSMLDKTTGRKPIRGQDGLPHDEHSQMIRVILP